MSEEPADPDPRKVCKYCGYLMVHPCKNKKEAKPCMEGLMDI